MDGKNVATAAAGPDKNADLFEWNDAVPAALLIGIIALPRFDGAENLADKARKIGFRYVPAAARQLSMMGLQKRTLPPLIPLEIRASERGFPREYIARLSGPVRAIGWLLVQSNVLPPASAVEAAPTRACGMQGL